MNIYISWALQASHGELHGDFSMELAVGCTPPWCAHGVHGANSYKKGDRRGAAQAQVQMGHFGPPSGSSNAITNGANLRRCASVSSWASSSPAGSQDNMLCLTSPEKPLLPEKPLAPQTPAALAATIPEVKTQELVVAPAAPEEIKPAKRKSVLEAAAEIANAINAKRRKLAEKTPVDKLPAAWAGKTKGARAKKVAPAMVAPAVAAPAVAAPATAAAKAGATTKTAKEKAYNSAWLKAKNAALAAGKSLDDAKAAGRAAGKAARDAIA